MGARSDSGLTRATLLRRAAAASGASLVGAAALVGPPELASSAPSAAQDAEVLAFLLELEELQEAFYAEAIAAGALPGAVAEYARVVGGHERDHVAYLRGALGTKAAKSAAFDFGDAVVTPDRFLAVAVELEEAGLAAYTGAAVNLTARTLREAARIVSVEARHTAWARDLAGRNPAPDASDEPISEAQARATIRGTGFVRAGG